MREEKQLASPCGGAGGQNVENTPLWDIGSFCRIGQHGISIRSCKVCNAMHDGSKVDRQTGHKADRQTGRRLT